MTNYIFWLTVISLFLIAIIIYFSPSIIARARKHHNSNAILVLNLFLGFTFVGWVFSLAWAFTKVEPA